MEVVVLPKRKKSATWKHVSVKQHNVIEMAGVKKLNFFYIGSSSENINGLITDFESGYAAVTTADAQSMLKRLLINPSQITVPDFIIAEASISEQSLREFYYFLRSKESLAAIPFFAEASGIDQEDVELIKGYDFIDDILFLNKEYSKKTLINKVNFLKKVKLRFTDELAARSLALSVQTTPAILSVAKRIFDIIISLTLLTIFSPVFLLAALAIRIESKGPVFYISKRAGRGYKIFNFFKFRTMPVGADEKLTEFTHMNQYHPRDNSPLFYKINNDPRITKVGKILRKTSLDELPQLLNVLKGNMSIVGNRPLPLKEAASLTTDEWSKRFLAPAGMTGLWQIKKRGRKIMSVEERIRLDINYADKRNFMYDLWIMINTPSALIQRVNA